MGKHIHLYSTEQEFEADYNGTGYTEPWVSLTLDVDRVDYNKGDEPGPIVCDYYLVYDMEDYQTQCGSGYNLFGPHTVGNYGYKIWSPVDGDVDMSVLMAVTDFPVNIAVTVNNFNAQGNNVTRTWAFNPLTATDASCGFPFTAEDFNEEDLPNYVAWGPGSVSNSNDVLFGIIGTKSM